MRAMSKMTTCYRPNTLLAKGFYLAASFSHSFYGCFYRCCFPLLQETYRGRGFSRRGTIQDYKKEAAR